MIENVSNRGLRSIDLIIIYPILDVLEHFDLKRGSNVLVDTYF